MNELELVTKEIETLPYYFKQIDLHPKHSWGNYLHTIEIWSKTRFRKDAVAERNKEAYEQLRRRAVATGDEMPPYFLPLAIWNLDKEVFAFWATALLRVSFSFIAQHW